MIINWLLFFFTDLSEPSFFQRVIGLFSSNEEPEMKFTTNDIEMTTFTVVSGQSPDVLMPALCCSAAGRTPNGRGSITMTYLYCRTILFDKLTSF